MLGGFSEAKGIVKIIFHSEIGRKGQIIFQKMYFLPQNPNLRSKK